MSDATVCCAKTEFRSIPVCSHFLLNLSPTSCPNRPSDLLTLVYLIVLRYHVLSGIFAFILPTPELSCILDLISHLCHLLQ